MKELLKWAAIAFLGGCLMALMFNVCNAATLRVPRDYCTIQAAIDATAAGDTVLVSPGTYREDVETRHTVFLFAVDYAATIDGRVTARTPTHQPSTLLQGFGVTNGVDLAGDGIVVRFCTVYNGVWTSVWSSTLSVVGTTIYVDRSDQIRLVPISWADFYGVDIVAERAVKRIARIQGGLTIRGGRIDGAGSAVGFLIDGGSLAFTEPKRWDGPPTEIENVRVPVDLRCGKVVHGYSTMATVPCD